MFRRFNGWFARFMYGRYGSDQLNVVLLVFGLAISLAGSFSRLPWLAYLSWVPFFAVIFRMFSRNIVRRRGENARFMTVAGPAIRWVKLRRTIHRDKDHLYFKCPNCGQQLRAPRGKGKITVNCRNCGVSFEEKT